MRMNKAGETTMSKDRKTGSSLVERVAAFHRDHRGVAAIEFAFIAPLLLVLYFVTMETGLAIESNKKVGRTASIVADLVTQNKDVTKADLDAIMKIGEGTLQPYNRSAPEIRITGVQFDTANPPQATVTWSRKLIGTATSTYLAANTNVTNQIPDKLRIAGSFLVRVETLLDYKPVITWTSDQKQALGITAAFTNINMGETYHLRPRQSANIVCVDC